MLSKEEKNAIEFFEECIKKDHLFEEDLTLYFMKTVLNLITRLQKENEEKDKEIDMLSKIISLMLDDLDTKGFGKENIYNSYKHRVEHNEKYFQ